MGDRGCKGYTELSIRDIERIDGLMIQTFTRSPVSP